MTMTRRFAALGFLACSFALFATATANAGGVVKDCSNDTALSDALAGGGKVSFNCGGKNQAATIALSFTKAINNDVLIDGGGKIILSGERAMQLFFVGSNASLFLKNIELDNGSSPDDGGCIFNGGFLTLENTVLRDCRSGASGGAIATTGTVNITGGALFENRAVDGGALSATGSAARVTIVASTLSDNEAHTTEPPNGKGGAIYLTGGAGVSINLSELFANFAQDSGGAIAIDATSSAALLNSSVHNNQAGSGGGILNLVGTLSLMSSTVSQNSAGVTGGGVKNESGTANLSNVTISGNTAFGGGGFYNYNATANLTNVTIAGNSASNIGGGITNSSFGSPHLHLRNILFADSPRGGNCFFGADPDESTSNLSSDGTCGLGVVRDNVPVNLGPLGTNGGATSTHRLRPGSPAIDAGTIFGCPSTDQRGSGRYYLHSCDVGAVEFVACAGAPPAPTLLAPANKDKHVLETAVLFDWTGPDCASDFSLVVRQGSKHGPLVFRQDAIAETEATAPTLRRGRQYYWQTTACNAAGCTASEWRTFKIESRS